MQYFCAILGNAELRNLAIGYFVVGYTACGDLKTSIKWMLFGGNSSGSLSPSFAFKLPTLTRNKYEY